MATDLYGKDLKGTEPPGLALELISPLHNMELIDKPEKLELLKLPAEILHLIMFQAALERGVKRALRLRLVCKTFAIIVYPALFETHLMDTLETDPMDTLFNDPKNYPDYYCEYWNRMRQDIIQPRITYVGSFKWHLDVGSLYGADNVWQSYFVYRVMDKRDSSVDRFVRLRELAEAISQEMEKEGKVTPDLRTIAEGLCWLFLMKKYKSHLEYHMGMGDRQLDLRASLGINLLSAATYFDLWPFARQLVAEGHNPSAHTDLFAAPIQIAAQTGNLKMLQFFQNQLSYPYFGHQFEFWSVVGAAIRGDLKILKLAIRLPSGFGITFPEIMFARSYTSSPEVYEYLTGLLAPLRTTWCTPPAFKEESTYKDLENNAQLGNTDMVRCLLDRHVPGHQGISDGPLIKACKGLRDRVIVLLLDRGADPDIVTTHIDRLFNRQ